MWSLGIRGWITPYIECCARIFNTWSRSVYMISICLKCAQYLYGGTDRTCEVLSNNLEIKIVEDPFYDSSLPPETNNCQDSTEKIGRTDNETN